MITIITNIYIYIYIEPGFAPSPAVVPRDAARLSEGSVSSGACVC